MTSDASHAHKLALKWRDKFSTLPKGASYGAITALLTRELEFLVAMTHPETRYNDLPPTLKFLQDEIGLANDIKPNQKIDSDMLTVLTMVTGVAEVFLASMINLHDISVLAVQAQEAAEMITIDDVMDAAPKEEVRSECDIKPEVENLEDMTVEQLEAFGRSFLEPMEVEAVWNPVEEVPPPHIQEMEETRPRRVIKTESTRAVKNEAALHKEHDKIGKRNGLRKIKNEMMDDDEEEVFDFKQVKRRRPRKIKNEVVDDDEEEVTVSKTIQKRARPRKIKNEVLDDDAGLDGRPLILHTKKVKTEAVNNNGELDGRPLIPHSRLITIRKVKAEPTDEIRTSSKRTIKKAEKAIAMVKVKREPLTCVVTGADCFVCKNRIVRTLRGYTDHLSKHKVVLRTCDHYLVCSCGREIYATMEARVHQNECDRVGEYYVALKNNSPMND
ncbi:hypothetical protein PRIPAC_84957 [Pristionchus pacificus]|uniref:Uncharacterized protein n=1 Tax=Pristionchus pacificus TaxID=54126 RepID=A0A454XR17_PRIPA|nr:hypothetical protein PRIPAC_84957 [Pristionchus pacificus]|eukprot:PDM75846.1 hypothetical protein PRIPAC_40225 [Pristionchus pacificus]